MIFIKKLTATLLSLSIYLFISSTYIFAGEEFQTSFFATYNISPSGNATVTQNIQLTNKLSNVYATQYALEIGSTRVNNVNTYAKSGEIVEHNITNVNNKTIIVSNFDKKVVGKGQTLDFTVKYDNLDVTQKTGNILEINIPKVSQESDIDEYQVTINIPIIFGQPKIISPSDYQQTQTSTNTILTFDSNQVKESGITAIFGSQQIYNFALTYNLENPSVSNAVTQVALPPDTNYQKVFYENISPQPEKIELDDDGNWIATFKLEPKQRISAIAKGSAIVYMEPLISIPTKDADYNQKYLSSQKYWSINNPKVKSLIQDYNTPESIYNYLVNNFTYNYERIDSGISRLGVIDALEHKDNAVCTEFTDTFITLARSSGIPARELNGYAHTENSVLKPLSLIQDVLHSWPEYYDADEKLWKPIDPTWGNTTGGIDYFSNLDFNHFVFAIHGSSSERPYPAGYYKFENVDSKDLDISFGTEAPKPNINFDILFEDNTINPFSLETDVKITIKNKSNIALYNQPIKIDAKNAILTTQSSSEISSILPLETIIIEVKIKPTGENPSIILNLVDKNYESIIQNTIDFKKIGIIAGIIALGAIIILLGIKLGSGLISKLRK